jgi:hypothetical protein
MRRPPAPPLAGEGFETGRRVGLNPDKIRRDGGIAGS